MTSLKTSIKTITYLSDIGCLEIQGASLVGMSIIAIVLFQWYEQLGIHLTVAPFSLLGIAIAIFLGFRNNATYSRFVEARALWGTMIIAQRNIMRLIINLLPDEKEIHNTISDYLIAFSWSLKNQLRNNDASYEVYRILPKSLFLTVMNSAYDLLPVD